MKKIQNNLKNFEIKNISLSEDELKVINGLYEYHNQNAKWPFARAFRQKIGREIVEMVENRKNPRLIVKYNENGSEFYKLTFVGILLCPKAKDDVNILYRYLDFIKQEFRKNPEIQKVKSIQVEDALKLSKEQSKRLFELINIGSIYSSSSSSWQNEWEVGIPSDIEDLAELESPQKYLAQRIEKYYITSDNKQKQKKTPFMGYQIAGYQIEDKSSPNSVWKHIKSEYGLNQRAIAMKINFIKDSFRRSIILRDIRDAVFALDNGMTKIAVVLSGGVIEEILRCKLETKNIKPVREDLYNYIETCLKNNIIKQSTANLLHAIRDFRNLVHLKNEKSRKDTMSGNEASTTINSIFTLLKNL